MFDLKFEGQPLRSGKKFIFCEIHDLAREC